MDKSDKFGTSESPLDTDEPDEPAETTENDTSTEDGESSTPSMPYIYWRNNVKEDRGQIHTYVRNDTEQDLLDVERELNREFEDDTVYTLDVREAVLKAGLQNEEVIYEIMREWGYDYR